MVSCAGLFVARPLAARPGLALALLCLALAGLGCATGEASGDDPPRGPLGKGDLLGSCAGEDGDYCGGKLTGTCWCNDDCISYGDCCEDYAAVCGAPGIRAEVLLTDPFCDVCTAEDKAVLRGRSPIVARVVELIDGAAKSVDVAQFTFTVKEIEEAFLRAHQRGVRVRLAINAAQDNPGTVARRLRDQGVNVRFVSGRPPASEAGFAGLQHAKFMIVDGDTLLTGSNNWSSTGTSINEENTIVLHGSPADPKLAGFACHFEAIWTEDLRGAGACSRDGVAFSPGSAGRTLVRNAIRGARTSVDVLMHHFTFGDLVKELAKAQERGVAVRVIVNAIDREEHRGRNWDRLLAAGGEIRYKRTNPDVYQLMHHKLAIMDGHTLINGSGNWSGSAFFNNFENYVRYYERDVVAAFSAMYRRLWSWSLTAESLDAGRTAADQQATEKRIYFGNLHAHIAARLGDRVLDDGHAERLDDVGQAYSVQVGATVEEIAGQAYAYARDAGGMDFLALTPHCSDDRVDDDPLYPNMTQEGFAQMKSAANRINRDSQGAFLALAGGEWSTNSTGNHVNVLGVGQLPKVERGRFDRLYREYLRERAAVGDQPILMFNHPRTFRVQEENLEGNWDQIYGVNLLDLPKAGERRKKFNDYGLDDFRPLSDVRDRWILGELTPDQGVVDDTLQAVREASAPYLRLMEVTLGRGNEFGTEDPRNPSMSLQEDGSLARRTKVHTDWDYYLLRGFRTAPAASHDNHYANWGTGHTSRTAVFARDLSREGVLEAIAARSAYASEDENLELRLYADERIPMGGTLEKTTDTVTVRVHLSDSDYDGPYRLQLYTGRVGGSEVKLDRELSAAGDGWLSFDLTVSEPGVSFFYVAIQESELDRMAWSAPIWVTRHPWPR